MFPSDSRLAHVPTPALLIDERRMLRNIRRMAGHVAGRHVQLRPHLKTSKSLEIARLLLADETGPATVSTLSEAEAFASCGVRDIIYAVGITPSKLERVAALHARGCDLTVLLDSIEQAEAVARASDRSGQRIPAMIEIDCDGQRGGLPPTSPHVVDIGRALQDGQGILRGVLTHAGGSYEVFGREAHAAFAERERQAAVHAADLLRAEGLPCPIVSVGSTPTASAGGDLRGVTEVRAGVYVFYDLVQAGLGVCDLDDIALSVLTTVIGHQRDRGWLITDAGWMALSQDRGTASHPIDQGYGLVCDATGTVVPDLLVANANQEHGIVAHRHGRARDDLADIPIGTQFRVLPNHACSTAAQFTHYHVIPPEADAPLKVWERFGGW